MAARDVADGKGHGEYGESEGKCDTDEADAEVDSGNLGGKARGQDRCTAASEDKPEGTEEFGCCTFREMHQVTCPFQWVSVERFEERILSRAREIGEACCDLQTS